MPYELFIGLRYLKAKRKSTFVSIITFISIAGVALGVTALIVVLSVMTGFEEDLKDKILGTNAHVVVLKSGNEMENYRHIMEKLQGFPGVVSATPFIYSQVMLSTGSNVSGVVLRGIETKTDIRVTNLYRSMVQGRLSNLDSPILAPDGKGPALPGVIIGQELAKNLNLYIGDTVNIISPMGNITPFGMIPKTKQFRVAGIFNTGMYEYDATLAYTGLQEAQSFLSMDHNVTGIQLKVKDVYKAGEIAAKINQSLGPPYIARDWMQMNKNILFALKTEKVVMFIILTLIVLVAAFGIASTLFMVVMEKTKDIAILKSLGATSRSIMKIFVLEGLIIGAAGTLIGLFGGLIIALNMESIVDFIQKVTGFELFSKDIYYLNHFPSQVVPSDVLIISVTAILISFLATLYPSWQGSRLPPVEALRYE
jgi:lipoprotein-releasing system permease protein